MTVDATAPAAPVITSTTGSAINTKPLLTGTAEAGSTVTVYDGLTTLGTSVVSSTGVWTYTPATDLSHSDHVITAKATDTAKNLSAASIALKINTTSLDASLSNSASDAGTYAVIANHTNSTAGFVAASDTVVKLQNYQSGSLTAGSFI